MLELQYKQARTILASFKTVGETKELQQYLHGTMKLSLGCDEDYVGTAGTWVKMAYYTNHALQPGALFQGNIYLWGRITPDNMLEFTWSQEDPQGKSSTSRVLVTITEEGYTQQSHGREKTPLTLATMEESQEFFKGGLNPVIPHNTFHIGYVIPQSSALVEKTFTVWYKQSDGTLTPSDIEPSTFYSHLMTYGNIFSYWFCVVFGKAYILTIPHLQGGSGTIVNTSEVDETGDEKKYKTTRESVAYPYTIHDFISTGFSHFFTEYIDVYQAATYPDIYPLFGADDLLTERGMNISNFTDFTTAPTVSQSFVLGKVEEGAWQQYEHGTLGSTLSGFGYKGLMTPKSTSQNALELHVGYTIEADSTGFKEGQTAILETNVGYEDSITARALLCQFYFKPSLSATLHALNLTMTAMYDVADSSQRPTITLECKNILTDPNEDGGNNTNGWEQGDPEVEETFEEEPPEGGETVEFYEYSFDSTCQVLFDVVNPTYLESLRDKFKSLYSQELSQYITLAQQQQYSITKKGDSEYTKTKEQEFIFVIETKGGDQFAWSTDIPEASCGNRSLSVDYLSSSVSNGKEYIANTSVQTKIGYDIPVLQSGVDLHYDEIDFDADFILEGSTTWDASDNLTSVGSILQVKNQGSETMQLETEVWQVKWTEVEYIKDDNEVTTKHTRKYTKYYVDEELAQSALDDAKASDLTTSSSMTKTQSIYTDVKIYTQYLWLDKEELERILHWNEAPTVFENWLKSVHSTGDFTITAAIL